MQGGAAFSVNVFRPADILLEPSEVFIRTMVATVVLAVKKWVRKLHSVTVLISIIKDTTFMGVKYPAVGAHIYSPLVATTIL